MLTLTMKQIEAIEAYNQGDDSCIEHAMDLLDKKGFERPDTIAALCQLARERLTAGTFQQGLEAAAYYCDAVGASVVSAGNGVGDTLARGNAIKSMAEPIRALKPEQSNG